MVTECTSSYLHSYFNHIEIHVRREYVYEARVCMSACVCVCVEPVIFPSKCLARTWNMYLKTVQYRYQLLLVN